MTTQPYRFDFVAHDLSRTGSGPESTVQTIQNVADVLRKKEGGGSNDAFWSADSNKLIRNAVDIYKLAHCQGQATAAQPATRKRGRRE